MSESPETPNPPEPSEALSSPRERPLPAPTPPLSLTAGLVDIDVGRAQAAVNARIQFYSATRDMSLKLTLPADWMDFGGNPYLTASGAERLKALWGIYIRGLEITPAMDEVRRRLRAGEHVSVQVVATAGSRVTGEESEFVGGRSSEDGWLSERQGGLQEVDPADLIKAAMSNLEVQAITRLLGLRGLTWEDLAKQGIPRATRGVRFRGQGPPPMPEAEREAAPGRADRRRDAPAEARREGPVAPDPNGPNGPNGPPTRTRTEAARWIRVSLEAIHGRHALEALQLLTRFTGQDGRERSIDSWDALGRVGDKWLANLTKKIEAEVKSWEQRGRPEPARGEDEEPF
jgi:hypothetical protein